MSTAEAPPQERSVANRLTPRLAEEGWVAVPALLLRHMARFPCSRGPDGLSPVEVLLLVQLLSFKWTSEAPYPPIKVLAERLGRTERSVYSILSGLKKKGLINWERGLSGRDGEPGRANRYDLGPLFRALEQLADEDRERKLTALIEGRRRRAAP